MTNLSVVYITPSDYNRQNHLLQLEYEEMVRDLHSIKSALSATDSDDMKYVLYKDLAANAERFHQWSAKLDELVDSWNKSVYKASLVS